MPRDIDQQPVGNRLAGEAGTGSPKSQGNFMLVAETKETLNFLDAFCLNDRLRDEAIEAAVRGIGDAIDGTGENPIGVHDAVQ